MKVDTIDSYFAKTIDLTTQVLRKKQRSGRIGASMIGRACEREIYFSIQNTLVDDGAELPGRVLRCFDRGHWAEGYMAGLMRDAGFALDTVMLGSVDQYGFEIFEGRVVGYIDGIIHKMPDRELGSSIMWEAKCLNAKSFARTNTYGVQKAHPTYYSQANICMGEMGLPACLFTVLCADSMNVYAEMLTYDKEEHARMLERGRRIIAAQDSGVPPDRPFETPDGFDCRYCSYRKRCWADGK